MRVWWSWRLFHFIPPPPPSPPPPPPPFSPSPPTTPSKLSATDTNASVLFHPSHGSGNLQQNSILLHVKCIKFVYCINSFHLHTFLAVSVLIIYKPFRFWLLVAWMPLLYSNKDLERPQPFFHLWCSVKSKATARRQLFVRQGACALCILQLPSGGVSLSGPFLLAEAGQ